MIGHRGKEAAAKLPPQVHTRVTGNGTRESEQAAHLANLWLAQVEKDVADLIRRALAWAQNHEHTLASLGWTASLSSFSPPRLSSPKAVGSRITVPGWNKPGHAQGTGASLRGLG